MRKAITTVGLVMMLAAGTFANDGIIIAGRAAQPTAEGGSTDSKVRSSCQQTTDPGIIIAGEAGIIIAGRSVLDIDGLIDSLSSTRVCSDQNTGIIIAGEAGIIIAG